MPALEREKYLSLATFRKSGKEVATPVWFASAEDRLWVFSAGNSGKVKRLRNSPRARVAACDMRGRVHGDWQDAEARVVTDRERIETAYRALRKKYGLAMWLTDVVSRLNGRYAKRAILEIELTG